MNSRMRYILMIAAVLAGASALAQSQVGASADPGALINFTWQVGYSKKLHSAEDCGKKDCLNPGDTFVIDSAPDPQPGDQATLRIDKSSGGTERKYSGTMCSYSKGSGTGGSSSLEFRFVDAVDESGEAPIRRMVIQSARLRGGDAQACARKLRQLSNDSLSESEASTACAKTDVIYWRIANADRLCGPDADALSAQPPIIDPETGQGTGNGMGGGG